MACPEHQTLAAFLQGALDPQRRQAVEVHLAGCGSCRSVIESLGHVRSIPPDPHGPTMRSPSPAVGPSGTLQVEEPGGLMLRDTPSMLPVSSGSPLGRYIVEDVLGEGGMGVVLRAHDPVLARTVAIKLIRPELIEAGMRRESTERFLVEARAMATLNHPNVVAVYDAGQHENTIFIAMEYVPGQTLEDWLKVPRRPFDIVTAFIEAATGLQAAHDAGTLHRDFKPQNVLVGIDGRMRVTDFGLARNATQRGITAPGAVMGTPAYMSPEQLFGQPVDARSDQFSVCVALWEALYGFRPFEGANLDAIRWVMMNQPLARPPQRADVPEHVVDALMRGLRIAPIERYPSLRLLMAALTPPLEAKPVERAATDGGHIKVNLVAQVIFTVCHLVLLMLGLFGANSGGDTAAANGSGSTDASVVVAGLWVLATGLFLILGWVWAPFNAYGLWRRAAWARVTTLIYGAFALLTLIGIPYGIYAIWSLTRPEVKRAFRNA